VNKLVFKTANNIWLKGCDVTKILDYAPRSDPIGDHVPLQYQKKYSKLKSDIILMTGSFGENTGPIKSVDPKTIFINQPDLFRLVMKSTKTNAIEFQEWISDAVLPQIFKYGTCSSSPIDLKNFKYYNDHLLSQFENKSM
jgi:prophage antirepressor-like protein